MAIGNAQARELITLLHKAKRKIATAESCTGGMIAEAITSVPGSSDVFDGGIVSYANAVKHACLGVREETLAAHGAVSAETAAEMAAGVCRLMGAQIGVAVTGIAGPGGGSETKPVGLVWFGICVDGRVQTQSRRFSGNRTQVRHAAVRHALSLAIAAAREEIKDNKNLGGF